ncbi:MAG TPA: hypothetical protein PK079_17025 [Leptospiraceae bacterium]|nr:hypothetical protein [Leptospiraceae bacterium]HMX34200.1 hypothetical protein [Leptospiraceae bacterium]HMY30437.1 hypothetical protein [Leptospiraceae bacterium]HMZ66404.1 hypothetical protein [Leptospiraceae bacterium]HNA06444.1 hypothetical protein [Leptospiraceae bacterium]
MGLIGVNEGKTKAFKNSLISKWKMRLIGSALAFSQLGFEANRVGDFETKEKVKIDWFRKVNFRKVESVSLQRFLFYSKYRSRN